MLICVLATASAKRGALSIYNQFLYALANDVGDDEWHVFVDVDMPMPEIPQVSYHVCHTKGLGRLWFDLVGFRRLVRSQGITPDVVFSLQNTSVLLGGARSVIYYHQSLPLYRYKIKWFDKSVKENVFYEYFYPLYVKLFLNKRTWVAVQTETVRTLFAKSYRFPINRIGVYFPKAEMVKAEDVAPYQYDEATVNFLYPSMQASYKEHITLAYALHALQSRDASLTPRIRVHLTVNQGVLQEMEKYISEKGLCDNFVFHGPISHQQVLSMLTASHGLLFPSVVESSGMPLLEAAMLGVPIVANDMGYVYDSLSTYDGVRTVQVHDYDAWAEKIRELSLKTERYKPYVLHKDDSWKRLFVLIRKGEVVPEEKE